MNTRRNSKQLHFQGVGTRKVVADFDGGTITSDAGALLLREIDLANHFLDEFASCFEDHRDQGYVEHSVKELMPLIVFSPGRVAREGIPEARSFGYAEGSLQWSLDDPGKRSGKGKPMKPL